MERKEVNINDLSPMMREYMKTKDEYSDTLLFYRLGDFYELFFEDAIIASHELELTLTGKNAGLKERVPMCGVPYHAVNQYINKVVSKGYKVAICEQVEDPKKAKGIVKREVTQIITSGTQTNTDSIKESDFNYICYVSEEVNSYSLSYCDMLSGNTTTVSLNKNKNELINYLVNLNIKEFVCSNNFDNNIINEVKNYNIFVSFYDDIIINNNELFINIKNDYLKNNTLKLLSYLEQNQKKHLIHIQKVVEINNNEHLILDKECVKNLELIETLRNKDKQFSLYWLLDKTKTAMGSRLLKSFIISPLTVKSEIERRHKLVELFNKEFLLKSELREYLYQIYDLERLCGKVAIGNANARDLIWLNNSLSVIPNINEVLSKLKLDSLKTFENITKLIDSSIDLDAPITIKEGNIIKEGYSSELDELKNIRKNGKDFISKFENEERERTGIKTLKIGYNKVFGYYIEVSKSQSSLIKEDWGYIRKQTISNSERYINPLLKEKEDMILNAEDKINTLEYEIFLKIRNEILEYIKDIQEVSKDIAFYDVIQSFSTVAEENNYVKPIISDNKEVCIINGRHPVVEKVIKDNYIENDIILNKEKNIMIITGPNMSGKSTYMRELAITIILNQIGSFVPAKEAKIPIFDKIFTRIGASDDLVGGESTFMVEMKESSNALLNATENSLILFDELGRGTSTYDGMALAGSIIEYIASDIKCLTLFSTHYHELTKMENKYPCIKNVHVSVQEKDGEINFLHKIIEGPVDKSYGINVAKLAQLPNKVIIRAKELLKLFESGNTNKVQGKEEQLSFDMYINNENTELKEYIESIDINNITPIDALLKLEKIIKLNKRG